MFDPDALPVPDLGLSCLGCGYALAGLNQHRCPECGRTFSLDEHVPPGDCPPLIAGGEEVRATPEIRDLLFVFQIPYVQLAEPMSDLFGGASYWPGTQRARRIGVPRERYLEAIDLVRRLSLDEPLPPAPPASRRTEPWDCAHCGENNPANFEICWSCGEAAAPSAD